jgi:hypothetical protein
MDISDIGDENKRILPVCLNGIFCKGQGVSKIRLEGITDILKSSF